MRKILLLFSLTVLVFSVKAGNYDDFVATCPSGQEIGYKIIDNVNHRVAVFNNAYRPTLACDTISGAVVIPDTVVYDGVTYTVTKLSPYCFRNCSGLTRLILPVTIDTISVRAFTGCDMDYINIPQNTLYIDKNAFQNADVDTVFFEATQAVQCGLPQSLKALVFGDEVRVIPAKLCYNNTLLSSVELGQNVEWLMDSAFYNCKGLKTLVFNDKLRSIGTRSFCDCDSLTGVIVFPDSLRSIKFSAFRNCKSIQKAVFKNNLDTIGAIAFDSCLSLENIILPNSVHVVGENSFRNCPNVDTIIIGEGLSVMGHKAFSTYSSSLKKISYNAINCITEDPNYQYDDPEYFRFSNDDCECECELSFGNSVQMIPDHVFRCCDKIGGEVSIPESVKYIGEYAFYKVKMDSLILGNGLDSIGQSAFAECDSISNKLFVPDNLKKVDDFAFQYCRKVSGFGGLSNLSWIGRHAFDFKSTAIHVNKLVIPASVRHIGESGVFFDCDTIVIESDTLELDDTAFGWDKEMYVFMNTETPPTLLDEDALWYSRDFFTIIYVPCGFKDVYCSASEYWADICEAAEEEEEYMQSHPQSLLTGFRVYENCEGQGECDTVKLTYSVVRCEDDFPYEFSNDTISVDTIFLTCPIVGDTTYVWELLGTDGACDTIVTLHMTNGTPKVQIAPISDQTVCVGDTVTIQASLSETTGGVSFSWIKPDGETVQGQSITLNNVTENEAGEYKAVAMATQGRCAASDTLNVYVIVNNPMVGTISLEGETTICQGDSTILTVSVTDNEGEMSYAWSSAGVMISDTSSQIMVGPELTTTYIVTATATMGNCEATATQEVVVTVNELPMVYISGDTTFCQGNTGILTAMAPMVNNPIYSWSNGSNDSFIEVDSSSTYTVTVTDANSCQGVSSVDVQVRPSPPKPTLTIENVTNCISPNGKIIITSPTGTGYTYSIDGGPFQSNIVFPNLSAGTYVIKVRNASNCESDTIVTIQSSVSVDVHASANTPQCVGGTLNLSGLSSTAGVTYAWSGPAGFSSHEPTPQIADVTLDRAGEYILVVRDTSTGCTNIATVDVEINALPVVSISGTTTFCQGDTETLTAETTTANPTFMWSNGFSTPSIDVESANTYMVTVTDANGCQGSDSAIVTVNAPVLGAIIISGDTTICYGDSVIVRVAVTDNIGELTYTWSSHSTDTADTIIVHPLETTSYSVTVTATLSENGVSCYVMDSASVNVIVNALPDVEINGNNVVCYGDTANMTATGGIQYKWYSALSESSLSTDSVLQVADSGTYCVVVTGENGCVNRDSVTITVNVPNPEKLVEDVCESYTWFDSIYYTSGTYLFSHDDSNGCEQVDTLVLNIRYGSYNVMDTTACNNFEWQLSSDSLINYDTTGVYIYNYVNDVGCPSADTLHLTIVNSPVETVLDSVCYGEVYVFRNDTLTCDSVGELIHDIYEGEDSLTLCDTLHRLILTVMPVYEIVMDSTVCDSLVWGDSVYTQSDTITRFFNTQFGCDSIVTLHLIVNHSIYVDTVVSACESFKWYDSIYTVSTVATHLVEGGNVNGCDSVETLYLTINPIYNVVLDSIVCDSLEWEDSIYYASDTISQRLTSQFGCDSVVTINLTVNHSISTHDSVTECEFYVWNGNVYDSTGVYVDTLFREGTGCDSVVTLYLTINPVYRDTIEHVVCYQFEWEGVIYDHDSLIVVPDRSILGCDSNTYYMYKVIHPVTILLTTSSDTICMQDSVVLQAFVSGDWDHQTSYTWQSGCHNPDTVVSPTAIGSNSYSLLIQDTTTFETVQCVIDTTVEVVVYVVDNPPIGVINGDTMLCQNQYVDFEYAEDMDVEQYEYVWSWNGYSLSDTDAVTLFTPLLGIGHDTTYQLVMRVTAKNEQRCSSETTLNVYVCPSAAPSKVTVMRKGMSNILYCDSASVPMATTDEVQYKWGYTEKVTGKDSLPAPSWNQRYYAYVNGIDTVTNLYWVETSVEGINMSCINRSYYLNDIQSPLSVEDVQPFEVRAYVNGDYLVVDVDNPQMLPIKAELCDIQGRLLHRCSLGDDVELHAHLPFGYAKGVYLLRLMIGKNSYSIKIIR